MCPNIFRCQSNEAVLSLETITIPSDGPSQLFQRWRFWSVSSNAGNHPGSKHERYLYPYFQAGFFLSSSVTMVGNSHKPTICGRTSKHRVCVGRSVQAPRVFAEFDGPFRPLVPGARPVLLRNTNYAPYTDIVSVCECQPLSPAVTYMSFVRICWSGWNCR